MRTIKTPDDFDQDAGVLTHKSRDFDIVCQPDMTNRTRRLIHVYRRGEPVLNSHGRPKRFNSSGHAIRFVRKTIEQESV